MFNRFADSHRQGRDRPKTAPPLLRSLAFLAYACEPLVKWPCGPPAPGLRCSLLVAPKDAIEHSNHATQPVDVGPKNVPQAP